MIDPTFSVYAKDRRAFSIDQLVVAVNNVEGTPALGIKILLKGKPCFNWVLSERAADDLRKEIEEFLRRNRHDILVEGGPVG